MTNINKINKSFCIAFLTAIFFVAASYAQTPVPSVGPGQTVRTAFVPQTEKNDDRYRIGLQDVLDIQVFRHPELNLKTTVSQNGTIKLFRLDKPISVLCKTDREVADDIAAAYKVGYLVDPAVTVMVAEQKSQSMSVMGAVVSPNLYYVSRRVQLLELLAMAGGPSKEAGTRVLVARTGSSSSCKAADPGTAPDDEVALLGFKMRDIQEGKKTLWMQPGDIVSVIDADLIYVYGNVVKPGEIKVREPITMTQAIASASGLKSATQKDRVRILRQKKDSLDREELIFNLTDIEKGKVQDPYLEPNDILAISQDSTKSILIGVGKALTGSIPGIFTRVPL